MGGAVFCAGSGRAQRLCRYRDHCGLEGERMCGTLRPVWVPSLPLQILGHDARRLIEHDPCRGAALFGNVGLALLGARALLIQMQTCHFLRWARIVKPGETPEFL